MSGRGRASPADAAPVRRQRRATAGHGRPATGSAAARSSRLLAAGVVLALVTAGALAQSYPTRPIRILTCEAGGTCDLSARVIAQVLTERLGQQVIVENRGAASGLIAVQTLMKAPADGHTLLFHSSPIWLMPFLQSNVPYDPVRDLAPVSLAVRAPLVLVVHPSLPVKSTRDLIALAKTRPGELDYGSGATGAAPHLAAELFKSMAGVNLVRIAHRGTGAAVIDLVAGRIPVMFPVLATISPHLKAGKVRALAVTTLKPTELMPGLPAIAESALPGYDVSGLFGLFAVPGTPDAIVTRLSQELAASLGRADVRERFFAAGMETIGSSPQEFASRVKAEMATLGKLIRDSGIRAN